MIDFLIIDKTHSITTDNAANMISAIAQLNCYEAIGQLKVSHLRCSTHIINIGVHAGLDEINIKGPINKIRFFCKKIHCSTKNAQFLEIQTQHFKEPTLCIVMDVEIRWNSTHDMLKTAYKMKKSISAFSLYFINESNVVYEETAISENDWSIVQNVINLLEPFYQGIF